MWTAAFLAATVLTMTGACGSGNDANDGGGQTTAGKVKLTFAYWGSDSRQKLTEEAFKKFEEKNPNIEVVGDFSTWDSYYEKLATKVAADDAPDVLSIEIRGLSEYARRGALADLSGKVTTTDLDQQVLQAGQVDGKQYAIPTGVNAFAMVVNEDLIKKAGQKVPDDKTWTWDQFADLAKSVTGKGGDGSFGAEYNYNPAFLQIFAAQRGEKFYDGNKIGMSPDTLKAWWATEQKLIDTKGAPDAAKMDEIGSTGPEQSLLGTGKGAMGMWWTNQLNALTSSSGKELTLMRMPKTEGSTTGGMFLQPAMYYAMSAKGKHPAEAAKLIDFLVNDPDAAAILLSDRGLPTNSKVLTAVREKLPATDQQTLDFIDQIKPELSPISPPPQGALQMEDILKRASQSVMFGKATPDEGAQQFLTEANAAIAG
jgi:multiple sugar transport system substrate-binding protein